MNLERCFTIDIIDDSDVENMEQFTISFTVTFSEPDGDIVNQVTGDPSEATIFIQDNDGNTCTTMADADWILMTDWSLQCHI